MVGEFAFSLAGHDRGSLYLIVREEENNVYLADGKCRTYANPKKKNRKHVQPVHDGISADELKRLDAAGADADTKIRSWLKTCSVRKQ